MERERERIVRENFFNVHKLFQLTFLVKCSAHADSNSTRPPKKSVFENENVREKRESDNLRGRDDERDRQGGERVKADVEN